MTADIFPHSDPVQRNFGTTTNALESGTPTRLSPEDEFPVDLSVVSADDLHIFHSKVRRQLDEEYLLGGPHPETHGRQAELIEELDVRDSRSG